MAVYLHIIGDGSRQMMFQSRILYSKNKNPLFQFWKNGSIIA